MKLSKTSRFISNITILSLNTSVGKGYQKLFIPKPYGKQLYDFSAGILRNQYILSSSS